MESFKSELRFRLWEYSVSHSRLLLRHRDEATGLNTDILFSGVLYMELPDLFHGLELGTPTVSEQESLFRRWQRPMRSPCTPYLLLTGKARYFVIAVSCQVYERQGSWNTSLIDSWSLQDAKLLYPSV